MTHVEIRGLDDLIKLTGKLSDTKKYEAFLKEVVDETANLMRNFAPVDTGKLEESIKVERLGPNHYTIVVNVPYAQFMEWGTRYFPVGTPETPRVRSSTSGKIAYHPFMRTAVYIMDDDFGNLVKRILFYK